MSRSLESYDADTTLARTATEAVSRTSLGAMKKRSVVLAGHRTSVSLENAFWEALKTIAESRNSTVNQLVTEIDKQRDGNLSSAIRVYILRTLQEELTSALNGAAPSPAEPL